MLFVFVLCNILCCKYILFQFIPCINVELRRNTSIFIAGVCRLFSEVRSDLNTNIHEDRKIISNFKIYMYIYRFPSINVLKIVFFREHVFKWIHNCNQICNMIHWNTLARLRYDMIIAKATRMYVSQTNKSSSICFTHIP